MGLSKILTEISVFAMLSISNVYAPKLNQVIEKPRHNS